MNMMIAELLAFQCRSRRRVSSHRVVQRRAHPVLDLIIYSMPLRRQTASHDQSVATSSCSTQGRPMESSDPTRGEAGVGVSNTEEGRSTTHLCVLKGLVQSMGPSRCEDMAGTTRSFRWTRGDQMDRALTTHEDPEESNGALAQRYPHFGSLDGGAVTTTTTSEIGSLVCFGSSVACIHSAAIKLLMEKKRCLSELQSDNKPLQPRHARLVGSTLKCRRTGASPHQENMLFHTPH
ncbi:BQ5605_C015g07763 [Microbotryum silenes-dioicae]|uniref:BQ5605_C015g07763 protein n=1 Tax=Microbotryum silenes-dioicae TaxID=796604 RepID=A0A2X0LT73_9BASI|nr:BQ5605_C015g07763 [Microbotryum silenes-dioicae]